MTNIKTFATTFSLLAGLLLSDSLIQTHAVFAADPASCGGGVLNELVTLSSLAAYYDVFQHVGEDLTRVRSLSHAARDAEKVNKNNRWNPEWDDLIQRVLPEEIVSTAGLQPRARAEVQYYCPKYEVLPDRYRRAFWSYLFQGIAYSESGFQKNKRYLEHPKDPQPRPLWSEGLLQLSYDDKGIYGCEFSRAQDQGLGVNDVRRTIFDPAKNLTCGVKILTRQLVTRGLPLFPKNAFYWSTMTLHGHYRNSVAKELFIKHRSHHEPDFCF